ncbi:MAG TPA: hypothetical protein PKJ78_18320 [Candidatus Hydrogenedentes bacterium]|nr:hypothetical protein [Candidatus Hydrogenedentota bacterium]
MKQEESVRTVSAKQSRARETIREIGRAGGAKADLGVMSTTQLTLDFYDLCALSRKALEDTLGPFCKKEHPLYPFPKGALFGASSPLPYPAALKRRADSRNRPNQRGKAGRYHPKVLGLPAHVREPAGHARRKPAQDSCFDGKFS